VPIGRSMIAFIPCGPSVAATAHASFARTCNTRFLRLVERAIPSLSADSGLRNPGQGGHPVDRTGGVVGNLAGICGCCPRVAIRGNVTAPPRVEMEVRRRMGARLRPVLSGESKGEQARTQEPPRLRPEIHPIRSHDCAWNTCQSQCSSEFIRVFETSSLRRVMLPLVTTHSFAIDEFRRTFQSLGETLLRRRRASPRGLHSIFAVPRAF
jgi:hypothetical protein